MKSVFSEFSAPSNKDLQDEYQETIRGYLQNIIAFDFLRGTRAPKKILCGNYVLSISDDLRFLGVGTQDFASLLFKVGLKGEVVIRNGWRGEKDIHLVMNILEEISNKSKDEVILFGDETDSHTFDVPTEELREDFRRRRPGDEDTY